MDEIFDMIRAVNRMGDKVNELTSRIDLLLKSPFRRLTQSEKAAAKILGISERTLATLRSEGKIPFIKIKRRTLYRTSDLYQYLKENVQQHPDE